MSIMLAPDLVQNKDVPKEYNMHMVDQDSMNTFIFTEKDLPGYRQYSHDRAPPRFKDRKRVEKNKRPYDNYRRAIPSKYSSFLSNARFLTVSL